MVDKALFISKQGKKYDNICKKLDVWNNEFKNISDRSITLQMHFKMFTTFAKYPAW